MVVFKHNTFKCAPGLLGELLPFLTPMNKEMLTSLI